jgi:hypothetical protein
VAEAIEGGDLQAIRALRIGRQAFTASMAMLPAGSFDTSAAATFSSTHLP